MKKFQKGDIVRRIGKDTPRTRKGESGIVLECHGNSVTLEGSTYKHVIDFLELIERPTNGTPPEDTPDMVNTPNHYMTIGNTEACDLIRVMLEQYVKDYPKATPYQIYCVGNVFKYRLRAGGKDDVVQEINKAVKYKEMHDVGNT